LKSTQVVSVADAKEAAREDSLWLALGLDKAKPIDAYEIARQAAFKKDYDRARLVSRRLLRDIPSYHDARVLLGRTYAWDNKYDEARKIFEDLIKRAPDYVDGYRALGDLERWAGRPDRSLAVAEDGLKRFPDDTTLLRERSNAKRDAGASRAKQK
jgi:tetratricopeptide (TPR) repeat protein